MNEGPHTAALHQPRQREPRWYGYSKTIRTSNLFLLFSSRCDWNVEIQYRAEIVWVKFVGTHAQYDRIDVETVNEY